MQCRVVVVGGGVMGCVVAWRLAQTGCDVTVLEKAVPGAEASSAAAGILGAQVEAEQPGPLLDLCLASRQLWPSFAEELKTQTGIDIGYRSCGALSLSSSEAGLHELGKRAEWMSRLGLRADVLPPARCRSLEPSLGAVDYGGLHCPDDHQVEPPLLSRAVAAAAHCAGVRFLARQEVTEIEVSDGRVKGVRTRQSTFEADDVVVAAGAWTSLLPGLRATRARIAPQHGQLVMLDTRPPILHTTLISDCVYIVPRVDGRVVLGATADEIGFHKATTAGGVARLLTTACRLVPALASASFVSTWSGLRPRSADGLPLLGTHTEVGGLHFAAGHHRNGILLAPITSQIVCSAVLGADTAFDASVFRP